MATFAPDVLRAAGTAREVRLVTTGRKTGKAHRVTIWLTTDGRRLFVRSGGGMRRDWPQNMIAAGAATLEIGGKQVHVKPRHITDPDEARTVSQLVRKKYGFTVRVSKKDQPLTPGEQASFELVPAD
jgi:deazaflavin-dependent oxidoreductase (nitroreductase family)